MILIFTNILKNNFKIFPTLPTESRFSQINWNAIKKITRNKTKRVQGPPI
jgi:hypothetical protein